MKLVDVTLLLSQLDEWGVRVWRNHAGWHWGFEHELRAMLATAKRGPFDSAVAAGLNASKAMKEHFGSEDAAA
jgi:hypothetical protein